jgi:hypothetical protein
MELELDCCQSFWVKENLVVKFSTPADGFWMLALLVLFKTIYGCWL